jgi:hypothetical protein
MTYVASGGFVLGGTCSVRTRHYVHTDALRNARWRKRRAPGSRA